MFLLLLSVKTIIRRLQHTHVRKIRSIAYRCCSAGWTFICCTGTACQHTHVRKIRSIAYRCCSAGWTFICCTGTACLDTTKFKIKNNITNPFFRNSSCSIVKFLKFFIDVTCEVGYCLFQSFVVSTAICNSVSAF